MADPKKILILMAHPSLHRSEVNRPLFQTAKQLDAVTAVDLYGEYPNFRIDIDREQQRLRDHDVIIFQFPLYWYSTPALLKEWQDLVLEYGFAYGSDGHALDGKIFLCALTAGGSVDAYRAQGYNHFTIRELLQPLEQMAYLTGMQYIPPFCVFGARKVSDEGRLPSVLHDWRKLLMALRDDRFNVSSAQTLVKINEDFDRLIQPIQ